MIYNTQFTAQKYVFTQNAKQIILYGDYKSLSFTGKKYF